MDDCTRFFNQIADLRLRQLEDEDQTELFAHLATCGDCRDLMRFHEDLASAGGEFGEVDSEALAGVRRRVLDEIRSTEVVVAAVAKPAAFWAVGRSRPRRLYWRLAASRPDAWSPAPIPLAAICWWRLWRTVHRTIAGFEMWRIRRTSSPT